VAHNSKLTNPPVKQQTSGCIRGVPSTNLYSTCQLDECCTTDYSSSFESLTFTPDPCLTMTTELPPVLHLHKWAIAVPLPDNLSCVISPYPDRLAISENIKLSSSANTSSSRVPISVQKTKNNFNHEVAMKSLVGTKVMADYNFECAKTKYDDTGSLTVCTSFSGRKAQVSEKQRTKSEYSHSAGETNNNLVIETIQNHYCTRGAFPIPHEMHKRVPSRNCYLNWLRLPNPKSPLIKYLLVKMKVITVFLSCGLLMSDNTKNEKFIIHEDQLEISKEKIYAFSLKSGSVEKKASLA